eukprot:TRINITY_DN3693_c0_g1_i1.p1 TRINITY_DN3693_c0_g1~~TRINITY_DN3693_c0_g1_i1.p1  ORF type:complete len:622 (-),score=94.22 TRINITY_DN3693_c0_g1_i1:68-1870(-)
MTGYYYTIMLLERGLCLVNAVVFVSFLIQMPGLVGKNGLTPLSVTMRKLENKLRGKSLLQKLYLTPTVFWFSSKEWFLQAVVYTGIISAVLGFMGLFIPLQILICFISYSSIRIIGQPWLGLQMHATIIETDFLYLLVCPFRSINPFALIFGMRFLVWRIMLGCGACKYATGDKTWRNQTAMTYHYYTQPLPNPISWYAHNMPIWFHKMASIATHIIEGPLTFLSFGPGEICRELAFFGNLGLTMMINMTGNYGFLGALTTVQSISLLEDSFFTYWLPFVFPPVPQHLLMASSASPSMISWLLVILSWLVLLPYLGTSLVPLVSTFRGQIPWKKEIVGYLERKTESIKSIQNLITKSSAWIDNTISAIIRNKYMRRIWSKLDEWDTLVSPLSIINRYAKFGSMTTFRWEFVFEGSNDGSSWKEYEFKYKINGPNATPAVIPFHLPGLDWRIWFLPPTLKYGDVSQLPQWFHDFVMALLLGTREVLQLLRYVPFEKPPKYVRVLLYDYQFTGRKPISAAKSADQPSFEGDEDESEEEAEIEGEIEEDDDADADDGSENAGPYNQKKVDKKMWWNRKLLGVVLRPCSLKKAFKEKDSDDEED